MDTLLNNMISSGYISRNEGPDYKQHIYDLLFVAPHFNSYWDKSMDDPRRPAIARKMWRLFRWTLIEWDQLRLGKEELAFREVLSAKKRILNFFNRRNHG